MRPQVLFVLLLSACNVSPGEDGQTGADGESCTVVETDAGALIQCPDGTGVLIANGEQGSNGETGDPGEDGTNCSVENRDGGVLLNCGTGGELFIPDGEDGEDGTNASPCSATAVDGGVQISCPDGEQFLANGEDVDSVVEPPSVNCPYGGTAFLINGTVVGYACDGQGFVDCDQPVVGDVIIESYLDIAKYNGCPSIQGSLLIRGINDLFAFTELTSVGGELRISNTSIQSFGSLSNLKSVGGNLIVSTNSEVIAFDGFQLDTVGGSLVIVSSNLQLSSCLVDNFFANMEITSDDNPIIQSANNLEENCGDAGTLDAG